jgi:polyisoprenyl-phosphate glycosyltransferase
MGILLIASGIIMILLGFIGVYVGYIFQEVKRRPVYLVKGQSSDE